jgi:hypothetical protein
MTPHLVEFEVGRELAPVQRSTDREDFRCAGHLALGLERAWRQTVESGDDRTGARIRLDNARHMHLEPCGPGQRLAERWARERHRRRGVANWGDGDSGPVELRRVEARDIGPEGRCRADAMAADGIRERYLVAAEGHFI